MEIKSNSFQNYPFSKLFRDYTDWKDTIQPFFEFNPNDLSDYVKRSQSMKFYSKRVDIVSSLIDYNLQFGANEQTIKNIKQLENSDTYTVVTGQQVMLYGGPLFTVYKIITAILTANRLTKELGINVIPVFWIADEDHDFEEVASLSILNQEEHSEFTMNNDYSINNRVVEKQLGSQINDLKKEIRKALPETDFSDDLWSLLDQCYNSEESYGYSFGKFILKLFGKHGLILAGSNHDGIKKLVVEPLVQSVSDASVHQSTLENTSKKLTDSHYHNQVTVQTSNLFLILDDGSRVKIQYSDDRWYLDDNKDSWTRDELILEIKNNPEKFSPNVFLRPVIQNYLLPVISYVAGPGEIAYYAQMRDYHKLFNIEMPVITPRFSATLIESSIDRIIGKLPFEIHDYSERIEDLEKDFIKKTDTPNLESIFKSWKSSIQDLSQDPIKNVSSVDPTLKKSADKTVSQFFTELDKLKGKLYRSLKESEKVQIQRIQKVQNNLYPNRNLQEREVAFIYYMNKYGLDLWDKLIVDLLGENMESHKLIYV